MSEEKVLVITDKRELYDKCENMEQLFDKYYLPLLNIHYKKTYQLQQENKQLKVYLKPEHIVNKIKNLEQENQELKNQLQQRDEVIDEAIKQLKLLISIGFDYDGFNKVESLKGLIDELVDYAKASLGFLIKYKGDNNE